jgi:hypothetical protein
MDRTDLVVDHIFPAMSALDSAHEAPYSSLMPESLTARPKRSMSSAICRRIASPVSPLVSALSFSTAAMKGGS